MKIKSNLWFENEGKAFFGKGRIELLEQIDRHGSISGAAKAMKMSYKAAWDAINEMNSLSGEPIVVRETGGKGGGGTFLTKRGYEYIRIYKEISALQQKLFDLLDRQGDALENLLALGRRLTLQTTARNQYEGVITSIRYSKIACEVELSLDENESIYASVTRKSAKAMGLDIGMRLFALIKSNWVHIAAAPDPKMRNALKGEVIEIQKDGESCEVVLGLGSGRTIISMISSRECRENALKVGEPAYGCFDASHVLLAK